jgi:prolyl-tRNA editing enzyme YbaK/EbsC (Cys-tRNA(Pro) deacylase)
MSSTDQGSSDGAQRALDAITATGIAFTVTTHGHVSSLEEAAAARGLPPEALLKSLVIRRGDDDFLFALVPGDRTISWPKVRALLGVSRMSMPDADTGYRRGTITPFGSTTAWPVLADERIRGRAVSIGGGASGTAFTVDGDDLLGALDATVADLTDPLA